MYLETNTTQEVDKANRAVISHKCVNVGGCKRKNNREWREREREEERTRARYKKRGRNKCVGGRQ